MLNKVNKKFFKKQFCIHVLKKLIKKLTKKIFFKTIYLNNALQH